MAINLVKNSKGVYHPEKKSRINLENAIKVFVYILYIAIITSMVVIALSSCSSSRGFNNSTSTCDLVKRHYVGYK